MELTPYRDRDSPFHRNRSSSCSSPTTRSFIYEEMVKVGDNALFRSYSCGQFFAVGENGETIQSTQVRVSSFVTPVKSRVYNNKSNNVDKEPKIWSVPKKMAIEYGNDAKPAKARTSLKFGNENPSRTRKNYFEIAWRIMKKSVYINIIFLSILTASYVIKYRNCNQKWDVDNVVLQLQRSVFGQQQAIWTIRDALRDFRNYDSNCVMTFIGSVGVGKSFVSSIIFKNFPWESNQYISHFDLLTEDAIMSKRYSTCGSNLLVLDGINVRDAENVMNLIEKLLSSFVNGEKILVIMIFQTHNDDEVKLVQNIKSFFVDVYPVKFKELSQNDVRQCFDVEIRKQKKTISQEYLNELVSQQMKYCNISKSYPGCKNVFNEVSRLSSIS